MFCVIQLCGNVFLLYVQLRMTTKCCKKFMYFCTQYRLKLIIISSDKRNFVFFKLPNCFVACFRLLFGL